MSPSIKNTNPRVAFYIRVSTDEQRKEGFGADAQLAGLNQMVAYKAGTVGWCHDKNWEYSDLGYSGSDLNRPDFKRLLDDAKKQKFDIIAVWKIDRLSRNLTHLLSAFETFQSLGVSFCSHKESIDFTGPVGRLTFQIFGALAEFERETIKMRTKEGKLASARLGNFVSNSAPYGYEKMKTTARTGRSLLVVEDEAEIVKSVFSDFLNRKSLESIAARLNELQVLKSAWNLRRNRKTKWYWTTIKEMLLNTAYVGRAAYRSTNEDGTIETVSITVPRIISDLTFEIVQDRLKTLSEDAERGGGLKEYLLSRKIVDLETGRKFIGYSRAKGGHGYRRKAFALDWESYPNKEIPGEPLERHVWAMVEKAIDRPKELFETFKRQSLDDSQYEALVRAREKIQRTYDDEDSTEDVLEMSYCKGKISEERRDKLILEISAKKSHLSKEISDIDEKIDAIVQAKATELALEAFVRDFEMKAGDLSFEQRKFLIDLLVEKIEVTWNVKQPVINVIFRFDHSKVDAERTLDEPKKGSPKPQSDGEEPNSESNGATSWARTSDLFLRREAL